MSISSRSGKQQRPAAGRPAFLYLFTILVLLYPLGIGGLVNWWWMLMAFLVLVLTALSPISRQVREPFPREMRRWLAGSLTLMAVAIAWMLLQSVSWTPTSWHHWLWEATADALQQPVDGAISVNPSDTIVGVLRLASYIAAAWMGVALGRRPEQARKALTLFSMVVALYCLYGIYVQLIGPPKILWMDKEVQQGSLTATFRNRNSFAAWAGMGLIIQITVLYSGITRATASSASRTELFRELVEYLNKGGIFLVFAIMATIVAILMSQSRAGTVTVFAGACVLLFLIVSPSLEKHHIRRLMVTGAVLLLVAGGLFFIVGDALVGRYDNLEGDLDVRTTVWSRTADAVADYPILGTGWWTFEEIFRMYRTMELTSLNFTRAHNSYLENALELGIPMAIVFYLAITVFLAPVFLKRSTRQQRLSRLRFIGPAIAVQIGLHSIVDFPLQLPATATAFAFLTGIACAQSFPVSRRSSRARRMSSAPEA